MRLPDLNDLIADLQLAKDIAIRNENANSLVTATLAQAKPSQAKLLGLDKGDTLTIKHSEPSIFDIQGVSLDKAEKEFEQIAKKVLAMV